MTTSANTIHILDAGRILFGPETPVSTDFLAGLKPDCLKKRYREKVLQTHPDRAPLLGKTATQLSEEFKQVADAYQILVEFIESPSVFDPKVKQHTRRSRSPRRPRRKSPLKRGTFFTGIMPRRKLMLAEYLYYAGAVSREEYFKSICWQRSQRPLMGQIAIDWDFLTQDDIIQILDLMTLGERFGECAFRTGLINRAQYLALLDRQRSWQKPIGNYFVRRGLLSETRIRDAVAWMLRHNLQAAC